MPRVPLLGGAYQSRSIIASAQKCINLYPEVNEDPQAPTPVTHFPTPGLTLQGTPPLAGPSRCLYRTSHGELFIVVYDSVYFVDTNFGYTLVGTIAVGSTQVVMSDNGLVIVLVDGSTTGYAIDMATHAFAVINDPNFLGGTFVDYIDTFLIFNTPGTFEWQTSLALVTFDNLTAGVITPPNLYAAFDPLDVATKNGSPDPIVGLIVMHRNIWIIGELTTEAWYNSGAADFAFAPAQGVFIEHGCIAPYSIARQDLSVFWLSQDRQGKCLVLRGGADFVVKELSSKGIEAIFSSFSVVQDAIGGCFQIFGHAYYVITFPTANRTFAVELKTGQWHELAYTGPDQLERHRANGWAFAYDMNVVCDYQNGKIYELDPNNMTDDGNPITRLRTIPHLLNDGKRIRLDKVMADTQGGTLGSDNPSPTIFLRVSNNRGGSYGNAVEGRFGDAGEYGEFPTWNNLGMGRDFVLELSWSDPINTALNGIFYEATPALT